MLKRKDKILISAIELLDQEGVYGLTTKKLAERQGVTEPALYRQYKSKKDIIAAIIEEFANYDDQIRNTIRESGLRGRDGILFYIRRYSELYENYSELTTVVFSFDLYRYDADTDIRMKEIMKKRYDFLEEIITASPQMLQNSLGLSARELASLIQGIIYSQTFEWRMMEKRYSLQDRIVLMTTRILDAK